MEICVPCGWKFLNHFDIVSGHLIAVIQLAVSCGKLYFVRCCALKKQGYVFILTDFKSDVYMFHSWHQSVCQQLF